MLGIATARGAAGKLNSVSVRYQDMEFAPRDTARIGP